MDLIYLAFAALLVALTIAFAKGCAKLGERA